MANIFSRLGAISTNCGGQCCNCCSGSLPHAFTTIGFTHLGLVNGSCDQCETWNREYVLQRQGIDDTWIFGGGFFCRLQDAAGYGTRIWAGEENNSDSVGWTAYGSSLILTRSVLTSGGCLWNLTFEIASGCQYVGDESFDSNCQGGSQINVAAWQYASPVGESCSATKTLQLVHNALSPIFQGWVSKYELGPGDGDFSDIGKPEPDEVNEMAIISLGPMCLDGPHFAETIQITAA